MQHQFANIKIFLLLLLQVTWIFSLSFIKFLEKLIKPKNKKSNKEKEKKIEKEQKEKNKNKNKEKEKKKQKDREEDSGDSGKLSFREN